MANDTGGNVKVDFVWGNVPMQPDDARTGSASNFGGSTGDTGWSATTMVKSAVLATGDITVNLNNGLTSSVKTNHAITVNNWNKYPDYDPVAPYLDTVDQAAMVSVLGLTETAANAALVAAGFVKGTVTTTATGATAENDGLVKTQSIAAAVQTNLGTAVNLVKYAYVAP